MRPNAQNQKQSSQDIMQHVDTAADIHTECIFHRSFL